MGVITQDKTKIIVLTFLVELVKRVDALCEVNPAIDSDYIFNGVLDDSNPYALCVDLFGLDPNDENFEWFYDILYDIEKKTPDIVSELMREFRGCSDGQA